MNELFGISTSTIAGVMVILLAGILATTAFIAVSSRTMFRLGLRNIVRRRTQSGLIVFGLMLSTLIITAAFATGDTIDHSLSKGSYDVTQRSDLDITWNGERDFTRDSGATNPGKQVLIDGAVVDGLEQQFASDPDIDGFLPSLYVLGAAQNLRTGDASPSLQFAGYDPERLSRLGGLRTLDGAPVDLSAVDGNSVLLSERAAKDLRAEEGDSVRLYGSAKVQEFRVAAIVQDELANGVLGLEYTFVPGGVAMPLATLRDLSGTDSNAISALTVALNGTVHSTVGQADGPKDRIEAYLAGDGGELFAAAGLPAGQTPAVDALKERLVDNSESIGNLIVTLFLLLGLFSIAAGVLLIFLILVMLASERRAEMGMARAIGAQRRHLLIAFVAEGMAYSLVAGTLGVVFGVLASLGMTNVLLPAFGGDYFSIVEADITWRALVIGYSLGVIVTFATVVLAAMRVTHVNIVAAIRDLPDTRARSRRRVRWGWVLAGVPALILPPLGLWFLFRKGLGVSWTWLLAPSGVVVGALFVMLGRSGEQLFPFALGMSLIPLSVGAMASRIGVPGRAVWTAVGVMLLAYWLLPPAQHDALFGHFDSDMEMFFLSGLMIVVGATLVIAFNGRPLTAILDSGGRNRRISAAGITLGMAVGFGAAGAALAAAGNDLGQICYMLAGVTAFVALISFASRRVSGAGPALKMAIAYPMSNRSRTGMTIAMFSLIVFSLTVQSLMMANFSVIDGGDTAKGNIDIVATTSDSSDVKDVVTEFAATDPPQAAVVGADGRTTLYQFGQEARVGEAAEWMPYPLLAADDGFLTSLSPSLDSRAVGYATDAEVLEAVRQDPTLALIDLYGSGQGFGEYDLNAHITPQDGHFEPFEVEMRNAQTGATRSVTVIGVLRAGFGSSVLSGIYLNEESYAALYGQPDYRRDFIRLTDGVDAGQVARAIEASLATRGVGAESTAKRLADQTAQDAAFNRMFQAFMALGLVVGIAGLGVISFRAVVERRQQIGMLRAIGFQRGTVALAFLAESGFIAVMGIMSGVVGGILLSRNLLTSDQFTDGATVQFTVPWLELAGTVAAALLVSLAMTWWPSRSASRVPVAEALRYE